MNTAKLRSLPPAYPDFHRSLRKHSPLPARFAPSLRYLTLLLVLGWSHAQAGDVAGVIRSPLLQQNVEGATVTVEGLDRRTATDRSGRFVLRDLPAGSYTLNVAAAGFQRQQLPIVVSASGRVEVSVVLETLYEEIEEIVVTSARASQLLALQRKRSADRILDAISADSVGKLPDFNAAEAIQRLPGLSVELDQGEGRYPIVRGIDSNLNNVTIDGNPVGAPEGEGRRVALDVVPSDLIAIVEVVKAATPDLDGNAVGGNINIVTRSAFASDDSFGTVSVRAGHNDKSGRSPYGLSGTWGGKLGANEQFGVVVAASYYDRRYETDLLEGLDWSEFAPGSFSPEQVRLFDYDITRERIGLNANLEYRRSDTSLFYLRTIFNEFTDEEARDQLDLDAARGDQSAVSATVVQNSEGRASREFRQNDQTQKLNNISFGGEFDWDGKLFETSYTYSRAEEITPRRIDWEYRSSGSAFPNTIDVGSLFFELDAGAAINDPANFDFRRVLFRTDDIEEDIHTIKGDLQIPMEFGSNPGFLKFGLKVSARDKLRDRNNENYTDAQDFTLADTGLFLGAPSDFHNDRYDLGPRLDFAAHQALFGSDPALFEFDAEDSALDSIASDYDLEETISAGYGMLSVDIGDVNIVAGVRAEYTDATYDAFIVDLPVDPVNPATPISDRASYLDWLPSIHMNWRPGDNWVVRAAWTNTIGRPNFEDVAPSLESDDGEGEAGNSDLKPFDSMGFDLSFEYYLQPSGVVSLGVFYKDIDNPIFTRVSDNVTFRGIFFDELAQPENADSGSLLGLEFNWEQQFVMLPAPFDGLGASLNLTFIDSEVDVFGRESDDLPFFRQPDMIGNAAVYYAIGPFEIRAAATYRDDYLQEIGGNNEEDVYFGERTQVDVKFSYAPTDRWSFFGEVQNVNDASRREFQGNASRLFADELYSWTTLVGASVTF